MIYGLEFNGFLLPHCSPKFHIHFYSRSQVWRTRNYVTMLQPLYNLPPAEAAFVPEPTRWVLLAPFRAGSGGGESRPEPSENGLLSHLQSLRADTTKSFSPALFHVTPTLSQKREGRAKNRTCSSAFHVRDLHLYRSFCCSV